MSMRWVIFSSNIMSHAIHNRKTEWPQSSRQVHMNMSSSSQTFKYWGPLLRTTIYLGPTGTYFMARSAITVTHSLGTTALEHAKYCLGLEPFFLKEKLC